MAQSADDIDATLDAQDVDTAGELTEWLQSYSHLEILGAYGRRLIDLEGQSVSAGGPNVSLVGSTSVGATSVTIDTVPDGLAVGTIIAIDAFTTQCELRGVTNIAGGVLTVAALKFAHASNDAVVVLRDQIHASVFGLTGDGSNEWAPMQRLLLEATGAGITVVGPTVETGFSYHIGQPLQLPSGSRLERMQFQSRAGFAPVQASPGAMIVVGPVTIPFTADAASNVFTAAGHGMSTPSDQPVMFCAPYGETFPTGVTQGQVYFVKTIPDANTFTVSATAGGATLDVTGNGAGYVTTNLNQLTRIYWDSVRLNITIADLNGVYCTLQQPSWTRNIRVQMGAAATSPGSAIGFVVGGQLSWHDNWVMQAWNNCLCALVGGTGHTFRNFNVNGVASGDKGAYVSGDCHVFTNVWSENLALAGIHLATLARGIVFDGSWQHSAANAAHPALLVDNANTAYDLGAIRTGTTSQTLVSDTGRSITIVGNDGSNATGDSDTGYMYHGHFQGYGAAGGPPSLKNRTQVGVAANYTVRRIDESVWVDTTGGDRTITIPTAVNWGGWRVTIFNYAGTNNAIIDPAGAETIDGAATLSIGPGEAVTIISGANLYRVIGRGDYAGGASQTYAASNVTTDRTYDANATTLDEVADVLGTLISDLRARKIVG